MTLKFAQIRSGLQTLAIDQQPSGAPERLQRLGGPATSIESDHQGRHQPFAHRIALHQLVQRGNEISVFAEGELDLGQLLPSEQAAFLKDGRAGLQYRPFKVGQCRPAPQRKRLSPVARRHGQLTVGRRHLGRFDPLLERDDVDVVANGADQIAAGPCHDHIG